MTLHRPLLLLCCVAFTTLRSSVTDGCTPSEPRIEHCNHAHSYPAYACGGGCSTQAICRKVFQSKRKVFNSKATRLDDEAAKVLAEVEKKAKRGGAGAGAGGRGAGGGGSTAAAASAIGGATTPRTHSPTHLQTPLHAHDTHEHRRVLHIVHIIVLMQCSRIMLHVSGSLLVLY